MDIWGEVQKVWPGLLAGVSALASMVVAIILNRAKVTFVTREEYDKHVADCTSKSAATTEKIGNLRHDLTEMRGDLGNLATREDVHSIDKKLAQHMGESKETKAQIEGLTQAIKGLSQQVNVLYENELKGD